MNQVDIPIPKLTAGPRTWAGPLLASVRPRHWIKNAFVLAPLVFSGNLTNAELMPRALLAAAAFCAAASAVYLVNDIADRNADRNHPQKRFRPIAGDHVTAAAASATAGLLALLALAAAWRLTTAFFGCVLAYAALMLLYCTILRRLLFVDVLAIAAGFVLRVEGGGAAIAVPVSAWLVVCTVLLSLFLGFGKRRHELVSLGASAQQHRTVLGSYRARWLDALIIASAIGAIAVYGLYCRFSDTAAEHPAIVFSFPFVVAGFARYLWHIYCREGGGSPEEILFSDASFAAVTAGWIACIVWAFR